HAVWRRMMRVQSKGPRDTDGLPAESMWALKVFCRIIGNIHKIATRKLPLGFDRLERPQVWLMKAFAEFVGQNYGRCHIGKTERCDLAGLRCKRPIGYNPDRGLTFQLV